MLQTVQSSKVDPWWRTPARDFLELVFDMGIRRLYRIEVRGLEHFKQAPSTLVVSNHRRDSDGPVIASVLLQRKYLHVHGVRSCFVAREDLFSRGFLGKYLETWPTPLRALLSRLDLGPLLTLLQAFPMRRIPERTLGEILEDVLAVAGDRPLAGVLRPQWVEKFERVAGAGHRQLRVSDVLDWRHRDLLFRYHGLSKLTQQCLSEIVPYERTVVESQLQHFSRLLDDGATLLLEPEGVVSVDGRFGRPRAGLQALLNRPRVVPRVLPVGVTYDSMTNGRERVFVGIGPELCGMRGLDRRETDERVTEAIHKQLSVTCSQLASRYLVMVRERGNDAITRADLDAYVSRQAIRYSRVGCYVDPRLLEAARRKRRVKQYIAGCVRHGILSPLGRGNYRLAEVPADSGANITPPGGIIRCLNNELVAPRAAYSKSSRITPEVFS